MSNKIGLIINADDYGYTRGVTFGILDAYLHGLVSSTTALTVGEFFEESMELASRFPDFPIGIHLALTLKGEKPLLGSEVPSLINRDGSFIGLQDLHKVESLDLEKEWTAQIEKFLSTGRVPTHLDAHHNVIGSSVTILNVALKLAKKYKLPLRNPVRSLEQEPLYSICKEAGVVTPDRMYSGFYNKGNDVSYLKEMLESIHSNPPGIYELNCHPGYLDHHLLNKSSYAHQRLDELTLLTSPEVIDSFNSLNIELVSYKIFK